MQQNTSFKLDRISIDDKFSPKTLNDNAAQVEAALNTMSTMMVAGDAALRTDLDGVDKRVTALEAKKMVVGKYLGSGPTFNDSQIIDLGFTPIAAMVGNTLSTLIATRQTGAAGLSLTDAGFRVYGDFNRSGNGYCYIVFG